MDTTKDIQCSWQFFVLQCINTQTTSWYRQLVHQRGATALEGGTVPVGMDLGDTAQEVGMYQGNSPTSDLEKGTALERGMVKGGIFWEDMVKMSVGVGHYYYSGFQSQSGQPYLYVLHIPGV